MLFTEAFPGSDCQLSSVLAPAKGPCGSDADDKVGKGHPGVMTFTYHLEPLCFSAELGLPLAWPLRRLGFSEYD